VSPAATLNWPVFKDEAERFFESHLARPRKLFEAFVAAGTGSGRRPGPRLLYWQAVFSFSIAALEAGLEDLIFAAHGARQGAEGQPITAASNSPDGNPRSWLVEKRLMAPNSSKVNQVLYADFGSLIGSLPVSGRFTVLWKYAPEAGSGRGEKKPGPTTWAELSKHLDTMQYIRNATAHGDAARLARHPQHSRGALWLLRQNHEWSVQQPHALTALRATLAVFNTVAEELAQAIGYPTLLSLTTPDTIDFPA